MSFVAANTSYENWMRTQCDVLEEDLLHKHERMKESPFLFLRATFFRWRHLLKSTAPELFDLPAPLAIGDSHVENFGTWRDAEHRLVWGANDYDDADRIPFASDLLRLTVSVRLAEFELGNADAAEAIVRGYKEGLSEPGPTLLDDKQRWMRQYVSVSDQERDDFWDALPAYPDAVPPTTARTDLISSLPSGASLERFARRRKGGGSLGRPRFIAIARWKGGLIVREAKALVPSGWNWSEGAPLKPKQLNDIIFGPSRAPDPFVRVGSHFLVRRISPDTRKVERSSAFDRKLDAKLLTAMASEIGSIHSQSPELSSMILESENLREGAWLYETAKLLAGLVRADHEEWKAA
jgi:hypothetical protein